LNRRRNPLNLISFDSAKTPSKSKIRFLYIIYTIGCRPQVLMESKKIYN
jgi:hypothetical protein